METKTNTDSPAERMWEIVRRIDQEKPAPQDLLALRIALEKTPGLWLEITDLADQAAAAVVCNLTATPFSKALVKESYHGFKRDLGHEHAPALEQALIGQVALAWLRLNVLEQGHANGTIGPGKPVTEAEIDLWDRRLTEAQKRYLRACETLAKVRKMSVAVVQVNIARQQVNVAGGPDR